MNPTDNNQPTNTSDAPDTPDISDTSDTLDASSTPDTPDTLNTPNSSDTLDTPVETTDQSTPAPSPQLTQPTSSPDSVPTYNSDDSVQTPTPTVKPNKNRLFILLIILAIVVIGGVGYTLWAISQQDTKNSQVNESTTDENVTSPAKIVVDDETKQLTNLETELNAIDDADYSDDTLSDSQLYN